MRLDPPKWVGFQKALPLMCRECHSALRATPRKAALVQYTCPKFIHYNKNGGGLPVVLSRHCNFPTAVFA
jgi:hypothetical protein